MGSARAASSKVCFGKHKWERYCVHPVNEVLHLVPKSYSLERDFNQVLEPANCLALTSLAFLTLLKNAKNVFEYAKIETFLLF
jgi:hypothetical protein